MEKEIFGFQPFIPLNFGKISTLHTLLPFLQLISPLIKTKLSWDQTYTLPRKHHDQDLAAVRIGGWR